MKDILSLKGKQILVTGAASGIGRQTCITLSDLGATLVMLDISEDGLKQTQSHVTGISKYYVADLSDLNTTAQIIGNAYQECGAFDGVVHCAGISSRRPINVLKKESFGKMMDINFFSFVEIIKALSKRKKLNDGASVVAMSSISAIKGYKAKTEYCVSKASLDAFIRCSAAELAPRNIRVNSIMAGPVNTPMAQRAKEIAGTVGANEDISPLGETQPYEVANCIAFLLSDATRTITGTHLLIDGGLTNLG